MVKKFGRSRTAIRSRASLSLSRCLSSWGRRKRNSCSAHKGTSQRAMGMKLGNMLGSCSRSYLVNMFAVRPLACIKNNSTLQAPRLLAHYWDPFLASGEERVVGSVFAKHRGRRCTLEVCKSLRIFLHSAGPNCCCCCSSTCTALHELCSLVRAAKFALQTLSTPTLLHLPSFLGEVLC